MQLLAAIQTYWFDFVGLLFPNLCAACNQHLQKGEKVVCLQCMVELPLTGFHKQADNPIAKRFWGRVPLQGATALYYFTKNGKVQHMIHQLKYNNHQEVGIYMGEHLGRELKKDQQLLDVDLVVPVPLHPQKLLQRGYNQSTAFAQGISQVLDIPVAEDAVRRVSYTESQTRKSREERWLNVKDVFELAQPALVQGKHVLLVDDVMTTGATLEACATQLLSTGNTRVSVATIAMAE